jgi:hypothetical protein
MKNLHWLLILSELTIGLWIRGPSPVLAAEEPGQDVERAPWILGQGEQRNLRIPNLKSYSLGGTCLRARSFSDRLLLKAACPGHGDVWILKQDGSSEHRRVRIEKTAPADLPPALERSLGSLEEAEVLVTGGGVVLRGEIGSIRESARIHHLSQAHPKEIHDETFPSEAFLKEAREALDSWIRTNPTYSSLRIEAEERSLFVRGSLGRPTLVAAAEKRIRASFPQAVVELDSLPDSAPTVHFRVFLLELQKKKAMSLGLAWPAIQEGAFRVTPAGIQNALGLDLALQAMEADGSARLLSNPELVVRAPGEAELFAGGEIPIQTHNQFQSNLTWKNFGLMLKLKILQSSGERVRLEIFTEVSHLDNSIALRDVPGIQANRMKTQVDARYGTPLLLSGLLQQGMREQARGLPGLRQIPILGALFGSDDYLSERSELVAILLPASAPPGNAMDRIVRHGPIGPAPLPRQWLSPSEERALKQSPEWPWNAFQ